MTKEYEVKFLENPLEFVREEYDQLIGQGVITSIAYGDVTITADNDNKELFKALVTQRLETDYEGSTDQFELNLVGVPVGETVTLVGPTAAFLTDDKDVDHVSSKGLPVPPVIHETLELNDKKI